MHKFCPKKCYNYVGIMGVPTQTHYVTQEDVLQFHGKDFYESFLFLCSKFPISLNKFDEVQAYYYVDYKELALKTYSFLFPQ